MKFRIYNTDIKLEFAFIMILAFAFMTNSYNVLFVILFASLHELGHIFSLYLFGGKADLITISFYGIGLKHSNRLPILKEFVFLLSGIAVNLMFVALSVEKDINLALAFINSLPVYPLDGGRALKLVLNRIMDFNVSLKVFKTISVLVVLFMFIYGIMSKNISFILITVYVIVFGINNNCD